MTPDQQRLHDLLLVPAYTSSQGDLLLHRVQEAAQAEDPDLLTLLASDPGVRACYFTKITEDMWVFNDQRFLSDIAATEKAYGSLTSFGVRVGLRASGEEIRSTDRVVLEWPYRDAVLEAGMTKTDSKARTEAFLHRTLDRSELDTLLSPKAVRNAVRWSAGDDDGVRSEAAGELSADDNLIVRGNNLLVLHTLQARFKGKVRFIYIDPPYATGSNDFPYNDRFHRSAWLTFMRDRLEAAWELLAEGGVLCVQIDYRQDAYLKVLMDELLGEDNYRQAVRVRMSAASGQKMAHADTTILKTTETIFVYSKGKLRLHEIPQVAKVTWPKGYDKLLLGLSQTDAEFVMSLVTSENVTAAEKAKAQSILERTSLTTTAQYCKEQKVAPEDREAWRVKNAWRIVNDVANVALAKRLAARYAETPKTKRPAVSCEINSKGKLVVHKGNANVPTQKAVELAFAALNMDSHPADLWTDLDSPDDVWSDTYIGGALAGEGGVSLKNGKKPEKLLARLLRMFTKPGDLVLDYHLGSGTTAAVAHKMGRRYIGIEQLDYGKNSETARLQRVLAGDGTGVSSEFDWAGGGSFVYCELVPVFAALERRIAAADEDGLDELRAEVVARGWLSWHVDEQQLGAWEELNLDDRRRALTDALDNNLRYLALGDVADSQWEGVLATQKPATPDSDRAFSSNLQQPEVTA